MADSSQTMLKLSSLQ